jgi:hypothetical protein
MLVLERACLKDNSIKPGTFIRAKILTAESPLYEAGSHAIPRTISG